MKLRAIWTVVCLVGLLMVSGVAASGASAEAFCTDSWVGPSEGRWQTESDWSTGSVPGSSDVACIGSGKTVLVETTQQVSVVQGEGTLKVWAGTLELTSLIETSRIHDLEMGGGTITGSGNLEVASGFEWRERGTLSGAGELIVPSGAHAEVHESTSPFDTHTDYRTTVIEGTWTQAANAAMVAGEGDTITNRGTFVAEGYGISQGSGGMPTFVNEGTLEKAGGPSSTFRMEINFEDEGAVTATSGYLNLEADGSSGSKATWSASEGAYIDFLKGEYSFTGGTWSGHIALNERASINGVDAHSASVESSHTTTLASGTTLTVSHFTLQGGEVAGAGNLKISGTFDWISESKLTGSGTTTLEGGATGEIVNNAFYSYDAMKLEKHTFVNDGTVKLTGEAAHLAVENDSTFKNFGTVDADRNIVSEGSGSRFVNRGKFRKIADSWGNEVTEVEVPFENYGTVKALEGKIKIEHPIKVDRKTKRGKHNKSARASVGCSKGDPVNCQTGNFYETQTDIAVGGRGVGLELTRTYNAQAAAAEELGMFGYGWASSYSEHLTFDSEAHTVTVVQEEGATVTFTEAEGHLVAPEWTADELAGNGTEGYTLAMSNQTVYKFSGSGRLESVTDRNGNKTGMSYNEKGQLATITDPAGRTIKLAYNGEGLVESATDPMGHVVKYAYSAGNLVSVTMPGESSPRWKFKYDESHRITTVTNGVGGETKNTYNGESQVVSQTDPAGDTTTWEYEPFATKITDEATGDVTLDEYTSEYQISTVTHGYGTEHATTETFTYNELGEPETVTDGDGHTTTYEYGSAGNKTSETDAEGHTTKWTYNAHHQVTSETLPSGEKTTIEYDEHGNPIKVSRPAPEEKTQITKYEYNGHGEMTAMIDPLERKWSYGYDEAGDRTSETDPEGDKTTWAYNEDSQQTSEVSPAGNVEGGKPAEYTTSIERNALGEPMKVTQPEGQEALYEYNTDGDKTGETDPNGHKTTTKYNTEDQPIKVTLPSGATQETEYNGAGQVIAQIDGNKHTTTYKRNVLGQVTEIIDPLEHKTTETYDADGNLATLHDAAGRTTTYSYNDENQPTKIAYSEEATPTVEYEYNPNGQLLGMSDGTGTTSYTYNQLGQLAETKDGHGDKVAYHYDLAGEITQITYPNGKTVKYSYDKAGRMSSLTDWLSHTTSFSYTPDSQPSVMTFPEASGDSDHYTYNRTGQLHETKMLKGSETLASIAYKLDSDSQVTKETQTGLPGEATTEYGYTTNEQLESAGSSSYEYDPAGNPTKNAGTTGTFTAADELTKAGTTSYSYNEVGQRTKTTPGTGPATTYSYNQAGELTSVKRPEEGAIPKIEDTYTYDGNNLRASETIKGSTKHLAWQLTGSLPLLLSDGSNSYIYGPEELPIEQINTEEHTTYLHHDQQGSTRLLTSESGAVTGKCSYSTYGIPTCEGTATTPLLYDGQLTSTETGLIYLRARVYDPTTAQFLSVDPAVASTHEPYGYAQDDPLASADPTGLGLFGEFVQLVESLNPIPYYEAEINAYESGCGYWNSIKIGFQGAASAVAIVGIVDGGDSEDAGIEATEHGAERIEERALSHDEIALTKTGDVYIQSDGATAYVKEVAPGRFNVIIEGAKGVVTALKNIPQSAVGRLAKKYGWK